ncbi:MAG: hypothetical protein HRU34_17365 [Richelia sp.]|nr:hypothetical protein [Richelia sp.]CDN13990.1 hypothetical protein RintRC_3065 [Richelia intracellularis]
MRDDFTKFSRIYQWFQTLIHPALMQRHKFKLNEASTWSSPTQSLEVNHAKLGRVKVSLWSNFHFRKTTRSSMSIIRVEGLDEQGNLRV